MVIEKNKDSRKDAKDAKEKWRIFFFENNLLVPKLNLGMQFFEKLYFDSFLWNEIDEFEILFL